MAEMDAAFKVYDDDANAAIEVSQWEEAPSSVVLRPCGDAGKEWYGEFDLVLSANGARKLAKALLAVADYAEEEA